MNTKSKQFLDSYLRTLNNSDRKKIKNVSSEYFFNTQKEADKLANLVKEGKKTATCSLKFAYEKDTTLIKPEVGNLLIVTDFHSNPMVIVETISVQVRRFSDVDSEFAYLEGEGDRSLEYWQRTHRDFFTQECVAYNLKFNEEILLYLEKFKVVYPVA